MLHFQKITVLVVLSSMLYACGGGGGGSTSTKVISEYERQGGLGLINAAPAYMAYDAASTNTVTVAVIDTGVDLDHPEFAGRIAIGGYDFFADDDDANPDMQTFTPEPDKTDEENAKAEKKRNKFLSHGTFVAGIIAAAKKDVGIHGVAYNAKILPIRIGNSEGEISLSNIKKGVEKAVEQGAQVINASFGSAGFNRMLADAWLAAHEADIISVHAAGNNFTNTMTATVNKVNPIFGARIPVESGYEDLAKTLIAVVATDKDNEIAKYSNRCGDAKQWCMAAPGNKIFSTAVDGLYFRASGTSAAAPQVSGAVAVIRTIWPDMTAENVVKLLYDTATDLGAIGTDDIYGRGLLNLGEAVAPQGRLTILSLSGAKYDPQTSSISFGSAFGSNILSQSIDIPLFDKYNRDYGYFALQNALVAPKNDNAIDELAFDKEAQTGAQIDNKYANLQVSFANSKPAQQVIGFDNKTNIDQLSSTYSLYGNSHLSSILDAKVVNIVNDGKLKTAFSAAYGWTDADKKHPINALNFSMLFANSKNLSLTTQFMHLQENDTFLANYFSGAFKTGEAKTTAINLIADAKLGDKFSFIGQYNRGKTQVETVPNSLITGFSNINSSGYSLSVVNEDMLIKGDKLFASFKKPLRATNAKMTLAISQSANKFVNKTIDISSKVSEKITTIGYLTKLSNNTDGIILFNRKSNPNHNYLAKTENKVLLKITHKF